MTEERQSLQLMLAKSKPMLTRMLPGHIKADRMTSLALLQVAQTPALQQCDPKSIIQAVFTAAALGLEVGGPIAHAYLVPYGKRCQLIPGYKGLAELARRSGVISKIEARLVYNGDVFEVGYGTNPHITHQPGLRDSDKDSDVAHVYAVAFLKDGTQQFEVMTRAQIEAIRGRSKSGNSGPWVTDWPEMAKKTVVKRLLKLLPMTPEMASAVELDNRMETGKVNVEDPILRKAADMAAKLDEAEEVEFTVEAAEPAQAVGQ